MSQRKIGIVGGGFAGLSLAQELANNPNFEITLIDRKNHHLFQPLLYQVAMAGLNPSEIAEPFRRLLGRAKNVEIIMAEVSAVDPEKRQVWFADQTKSFDYLALACGSKHFYFGNDEWERWAPGLKSLEQATEIRRRILLAFEMAEKETDPKKQESWLTFVIVGGGPTGVELAGAISEMTKRTLYKDYKHVDLRKTNIHLVEAGDRLLKAFPENLSAQTKKDLEDLGVKVHLGAQAGDLSAQGARLGEQWISCRTILWAAGVQASRLGQKMKVEKLKDGRIKVEKDLSLPNCPNVFVMGDQAAFTDENGDYLPGLAPVAIQEGQYLAKLLKREAQGKQREPFHYFDKGIMATIGRSRAVVKTGPFEFSGFLAWLTWALVHIAYLVQWRNRFFVLMQWCWSYFRFGRGARLIVNKSWRFYGKSSKKAELPD